MTSYVDDDRVNRLSKIAGVPNQTAQCNDCSWHSGKRNDHKVAARMLEKWTHEEETGHKVRWLPLEKDE